MNKIIIVFIIILFLFFGTGCLTNQNISNSEVITIDTITTFTAETDRTTGADILFDGILKGKSNEDRLIVYTIDPNNVSEGKHELIFKDFDENIIWNIITVKSTNIANTVSVDEWTLTYEEQVKRAQERYNVRNSNTK